MLRIGPKIRDISEDFSRAPGATSVWKPTYLWVAIGSLATFNLFYLAFALFVSNPAFADFRHLYTAGYMLRTGHSDQLYDLDAQYKFQSERVSAKQPPTGPLPYNHPAFEALLFDPLSIVPYRAAYFIFGFFNLFVLGVTAWMVGQPRMLFFAFGYVAVPMTLLYGQDSIVMLALFTAAAIRYFRGKEYEAGLLIGLASYKPQFPLAMAVIFLLWRRFKVPQGIATSGLALALISVAITGFRGSLNFVRLLAAGTTAKAFIHPEFMFNIRGMVYQFAGRDLWLLTLLVSASLLVWTAFRRPSFALAVAVTLLISYHAHIYDMLLLLIPLGVLVMEGLGGMVVFGLACAQIAFFSQGSILFGAMVAITVLLARTPNGPKLELSPNYLEH